MIKKLTATLLGNPTAHTATRYRKVAMQGVAAAQGNLTMYLRGYHNGKGVPQDFAEALHWLQLAAEQGVENALKNLDGMQQLTPGTAVTAVLLTSAAGRKHKNNPGIMVTPADGNVFKPGRVAVLFEGAATPTSFKLMNLRVPPNPGWGYQLMFTCLIFYLIKLLHTLLIDSINTLFEVHC